MSLLGQIQCKLDRVCAGLASKPNHKRKRVRVLGLTTSGGSWVSGSNYNSDPGQFSVPDLYLDPGQKMDLGSRLSMELDFEAVLPVVPSTGISLVPEGGLEPVARSSVSLQVMGVDYGHEPSPVKVPLSPMHVLGESAGSVGDGYAAYDGSAGDGHDAGEAQMPVLGFSVPFAEDLSASTLSRDWEDYFSSMPAD